MRIRQVQISPTIFILIGIALFAFFLRFYLLPDRLFFGPEQGKDFFTIRNIVYNGDIKLIGPKTDLPGIFHGPLYYYLMAAPFYLSKGDPAWAIGTLVFIQSLTVFIAYLTGKLITNTRRAGLIVALIFAIAFGDVVYARWLSGQQLSLLLGFLLLYFMQKYEQESRARYLAVSASIMGLLGQVQFINYLYLGSIAFFWFCLRVYRKKIPSAIHWCLALASGLIVGWMNFFLFDVKNNWLITKSIGAILLGQHEGSAPFMVAARDVLPLYALWVAQFSGVPVVLGYGMTIGLIGFLFVKRRLVKSSAELLLFFILVPLLLILLFRRGGLDQVFVFLGAPVALAAGWMLHELCSRSLYIGFGGLLFLVVFNVYHILTAFTVSSDVFFQAPQPHITYQKQHEVLTYVYNMMGRRVFELQAYTIPYFWQDGWRYLFWQYAHTHAQVSEPVDHGVKDLIVIIQKDTSDPLFQKNWYEKTVSTWGERISEKSIGEYIVEHRQYQ